MGNPAHAMRSHISSAISCCSCGLSPWLRVRNSWRAASTSATRSPETAYIGICQPSDGGSIDTPATQDAGAGSIAAISNVPPVFAPASSASTSEANVTVRSSAGICFAGTEVKLKMSIGGAVYTPIAFGELTTRAANDGFQPSWRLPNAASTRASCAPRVITFSSPILPRVRSGNCPEWAVTGQYSYRNTP